MLEAYGLRPKDLPFTPMIHWVAEKDVVGLLTVVAMMGLSTLANHLRQERSSNKTMFIACQNGQTKVVEYLIKNANIPSASASSNLCIDAATKGHTLESQECVKLKEGKE